MEGHGGGLHPAMDGQSLRARATEGVTLSQTATGLTFSSSASSTLCLLTCKAATCCLHNSFFSGTVSLAKCKSPNVEEYKPPLPQNQHNQPTCKHKTTKEIQSLVDDFVLFTSLFFGGGGGRGVKRNVPVKLGMIYVQPNQHRYCFKTNVRGTAERQGGACMGLSKRYDVILSWDWNWKRTNNSLHFPSSTTPHENKLIQSSIDLKFHDIWHKPEITWFFNIHEKHCRTNSMKKIPQEL